MSDLDRIIWTNVWNLAQDRGWTKTKLAEMAETRPQTLNNTDKGLRGVGRDLLARFAVALGVSESELMTEPVADDPGLGGEYKRKNKGVHDNEK